MGPARRAVPLGSASAAALTSTSDRRILAPPYTGASCARPRTSQRPASPSKRRRAAARRGRSCRSGWACWAGCGRSSPWPSWWPRTWLSRCSPATGRARRRSRQPPRAGHRRRRVRAVVGVPRRSAHRGRAARRGRGHDHARRPAQRRARLRGVSRRAARVVALPCAAARRPGPGAAGDRRAELAPAHVPARPAGLRPRRCDQRLVARRPGRDPPRQAVHAVWTALACLGAVAISTVASRSIFGLREQVREASQLGQYTLVEKIGEGGMGAVYRASHAMLRRPTAIKLLPPGQAGADRLQRFEREVQITSRLTHPNTVAIFDYGRTPGRRLLLRDGVPRGPRPRGPGAPRRPAAARAAWCTSCGRCARPRRGPRDRASSTATSSRPTSSSCRARAARPTSPRSWTSAWSRTCDQDADLTRDDQIAGTPLYMAPEAITAPEPRGRAQRPLLAWAASATTCSPGHPVFEGRNMVEVCGHHLHTRPVPPAARLGQPVPEGLAALLLACLEKEPSRRPAYAGELLEALDALADVPPWTNEQARTWWSARGAPSSRACARRRRRRGPPASRSSPPSTPCLSSGALRPARGAEQNGRTTPAHPVPGAAALLRGARHAARRCCI